ncbi:CAN2 protein, partial [Amia calva]|nr:CAN2 protein [Amia calva]
MSGIAGTLRHDRDRAQGFGSNAKAVKYLGQDYQGLRQQCLELGELFKDESFPAVPSSLGFKELGPNCSKVRGVSWKRPKDLCSRPQFIVGGATRTDICQGALGDCWLLAAIASLTLNEEVLARVVPSGQSFEKDYAGIFHFQFWQFGEWVDVVIDDRLPTKDGELLFVHSAEGSEFWSALLEKAYAKLNGSYEALSGGTTTEGFEDFTGGIAEVHELKTRNPQLFKIIQKAIKTGSLLGCSIDHILYHSPDAQFSSDHWLCCLDVNYKGEMVKLIRIRNPWGQVEWTGAWSDGSMQWRMVSDEDRERLSLKAEDGEFWMSFSDFLRHYSRLEICNLTPDVLANDKYKKWALSKFEGTWRRGSTAGGCRNYINTFWTNPQFVIKLEEEDDDPTDGEAGCSLLVGLIQKNRRRMRKMGEDMHTIGYAIYKVSGQRNLHLNQSFFQKHQSSARSETFINLREVCSRFSLPPGEYLIVPSTYEPHKDGDFCIRVFSEKQAEFQKIVIQIFMIRHANQLQGLSHAHTQIEEDHLQSTWVHSKPDRACFKMLLCSLSSRIEVTEKDVDDRFRSLFGQLAGADCEISAFELCTILNKVVTRRSEIKTDGFSLETCRNMVNLLDKDGSGKLGLVEFKILWTKIDIFLVIFNILAAPPTSLYLPGFKLNNALHQILVARYGSSDLTIDFDNFVGCVIRLETLFKTFLTLDQGKQGEVEFNLVQVSVAPCPSPIRGPHHSGPVKGLQTLFST